MSGGTRATDDVPPSPSRNMTVARGLLLAGGVIVAGVGALTLLESGLGNIFAALKWLVGGVVVHDAILVPATIVLVLVASRVLPSWLRGPATAGLVVLGSVTVSAIPVLGRFGARPDNPTLLDRNYVGGWLVLAAIVVLAVAVAGWRRRSATAATPQGDGGRSVAWQGGSRRPPQ